MVFTAELNTELEYATEPFICFMLMYSSYLTIPQSQRIKEQSIDTLRSLMVSYINS